MFQFGEPLGSFRKRDRFSLSCCHAQEPAALLEHHMDHHDLHHCHRHEEHLDPGTVLDISFRKLKDLLLEDLYRKVLIQNTTKTAQQEIMNRIIESIF